MLSKAVMSVLVSLSIVSSLSAEVLKQDMNNLADSLAAVQYGLLTNNSEASLALLVDFKKNVKNVLGNKEKITELLPAALKNKANIAINSAEMIDKYIEEINDVATDKKMTAINREMKAQKAFLNIQSQCFRCHNLVRDWEAN